MTDTTNTQTEGPGAIWREVEQLREHVPLCMCSRCCFNVEAIAKASLALAPLATKSESLSYDTYTEGQWQAVLEYYLHDDDHNPIGRDEVADRIIELLEIDAQLREAIAQRDAAEANAQNLSRLRAMAEESLAEEVATNIRIAERIGIWKDIADGMAYEDAEIALFDRLTKRADRLVEALRSVRDQAVLYRNAGVTDGAVTWRTGLDVINTQAAAALAGEPAGEA